MIDPGIFIRRAAVLGAGVMGAQVAAHLANAGIPVDLFELSGEGADPRKPARDAIARLDRLRPAPLGSAALGEAIRPASYDLDLDRITGCDLVIEAVAERMDVKQALYQRIAPVIGPESVLASNTSGLPIAELANVLPRELRPRFCGVHFFNPPRYMYLVELIAHPQTDKRVLHRLEGFLTTTLGKGVLHARDTPGFIGNRVGMFALCATAHHAQRLGLPFDRVDQLTGTRIGRPRSATFRTIDVVGIDTFAHVVHHLHDTLTDDPWRDCLAVPDWMQGLIDAGSLGQKSGAGIFRKGSEGIEVFDPDTGDYRPADTALDESVREVLDDRDMVRRHRKLLELDHPEAELVRAVQRDLFHYCAYHLGTIAPSAREIDLAMRWGFGWKAGPFETWQTLGWREVAAGLAEAIERGETLADVPLPAWAMEPRRDGVHGARGSWSAEAETWVPRSTHPVYRRQRFPDRLTGEPDPTSTILWSNDGVRLWDAGEDIAVLSFTTPMHTVNQDVLDGIIHAVELAETETNALILWQERPPFSAGADLKAVRTAREAGDYASIETLIGDFQRATSALRHARIPVIGAPQGLALGGGTELLLHCDARVLAFETWCGLVEAGVGVIPGGGGCAILARRAADWAPDGDPWPWIERFFDEVAQAKVTGSAHDARERFWLDAGDRFIMNPAELLHAAHHLARAHAEAGYRPPLTNTRFPVAGTDGIARLKAKLVNLHAGGFISDHDLRIGETLATVLCGGDVDAGTEVDDAWILRLEREGFMELVRTDETGARIDHMLRTGKPLRN